MFSTAFLTEPSRWLTEDSRNIGQNNFHKTSRNQFFKRHFQTMEAKMDQMILAQKDTSIYETLITDIGEKISGLTDATAQNSTTIVEK